MVTKTYKSISRISLNLLIENGSNRRVRFLPYSYGGGVYTTSDPMIQKALESHKGFGSAFVCIAESSPVVSIEKINDEPEKPAKQTVTVSDIEDAKEYLIDHFNVDRRSLRSVASIKKAADGCGIIFEGI